MASKNKVNLSDFNYQEDDEHSPMGSLAKKAKFTTRPDARKRSTASTDEHPSPLENSRSGTSGAVAPNRGFSKVAPNHKSKLDQTSTKVASKVAPNLNQSATSNEVASASTSTKVAPEPAPDHKSKLDQTGTKVASNTSLETLTGLQRNSLIFIYEACRNFGSKISPPIQIKNLAESIRTSIAAARVAVQRIEQKGFVRRFEYKDGRGGWTKYELPDVIYSQLFFKESGIKVASKLDHTSTKVAPEPAPEPAPIPSSSSSRYLNIKESTTTEAVDLISRIDLTSVQHLGITTSVLARCIELYPTLKPEQLEVLAFRFAEFARDPKNKVQNARGFFISLAEQASKGQVPLDHIETTDERLMRLFVSRQEEAKTRRIDFEQKAKEFECEAWLETLTLEMKLTLIPESSLLKAGTGAHTAMLKSHFTDRIWPERKKQILTTTEATP